MEVSFFCRVSSERTRGNGPQLCQGRLRLDIRKEVLTENVIRLWNNLPGKVVESVSGSVQELSVCGTWGYDLGVFMVVLMIMKNSSNLYDSVMSYRLSSFNLYLYGKVMFSFYRMKTV